MQPLRNTVWQIPDEVDLPWPDEFRVLEFDATGDVVILFPMLQDHRQLAKPCGAKLSTLTRMIQDSRAVPVPFEVPPFMTLSDDELTERAKKFRKERYGIIQPLVEDSLFLHRYLALSRSRELINLAAEKKVDVSTIHRLLNQYWRYGQTQFALTPFYPNCGGKGKQKSAGIKKRGRPRKTSLFGFDFSSGINIAEDDKEKMKAGILQHIAEHRQFTYAALLRTIKQRYADEIESAEHDKRAAQIPNEKQLKYWLPLLMNDIALDKKRLGEENWDRECRGLLGSVSENVHGPGDRFEIDSTVADAYMVSSVDRNVVLGRPVIYVIVDEASRMVVGLYVSIFDQSWEEAKKALYNAFSPKGEFCASYGLEITDEDWPCAHVPRALFADRAELLSNASGEHTAPMGIQVQIARRFRGDWKSVVERRFGIVNVYVLHDLAGTTRGKLRKPGEPYPPDEAFYTLEEITKLLIQLFVNYNNKTKLDCLLTRDLIQENLAHTPLNFWNWHIDHFRDSLSDPNPDQVRAELLPVATASVTARGICCDELEYTCPEAEQEQWFARARRNGAWSLSARKDVTSDVIWVRPGKGQRLLRCTLLPRHSLYANLPSAEVIFIKEWKQHKEESADEDVANLKYAQTKTEVDEKARSETPAKGPRKSKGYGGIRENRRREQQRLRQDTARPNVSASTNGRSIRPDDHILELIREACDEDDGS